MSQFTIEYKSALGQMHWTRAYSLSPDYSDGNGNVEARDIEHALELVLSDPEYQTKKKDDKRKTIFAQIRVTELQPSERIFNIVREEETVVTEKVEEENGLWN